MSPYLEIVEAKRKQRLIREGKKIQEKEPVNTELILKIKQSFITDERKPCNDKEYYRVMAWIHTKEDEEEGTKVVKGSKGFCSFDKQLVLSLDSPTHQYLYIELVRKGSRKDPGTSNGTIVMGRAKIKLPPWTSRRESKSKVDLVALNNDGCVVVKGYLKLSMKLHRYLT